MIEGVNEIDIIEYTGNGYKPVIDFNGWRVAFLRYAERFDKNYIQQMERHLETEEVFVLLSGEAVLVVGEEQKVYFLERNKLYNVKKGVWHAVCVKKNAQLMIVENADTSIDNTEYTKVNLMRENIPV